MAEAEVRSTRMYGLRSEPVSLRLSRAQGWDSEFMLGIPAQKHCTMNLGGITPRTLHPEL